MKTIESQHIKAGDTIMWGGAAKTVTFAYITYKEVCWHLSDNTMQLLPRGIDILLVEILSGVHRR